VRIGRFEIYNLTDGLFRLDGGAMFGIVPKTLWEKTNPPDERNRIRMNLGVLLIKAHGKNILVDTGAGGKLVPKWQEIYALQRKPSLEESLAKLRLTPDDIDIVINTHLHFDHAGGNTFKSIDGQIIPTFPKARYFVQKGEWDWAHTQHERTQYAYIKDDFSPLDRSGRLVLLKGDEEIINGVRALVTPGHTEHHQCVTIESENRKAIFLADLIPMVAHLPYPYIMGYDLFPLKTLETKKRILQQAHDGHWLLIFQHDPDISMGYLKKDDGTFSMEAIRDTAD
jgi:glyoxylase-like metal-dependent hydrolase (beta-lactamase superfamily II)